MYDNNNIRNKMILGEGVCYDLDCYKTQRNNNVIVVGAAGAGKTRGCVEPNIMQAKDSYVISDPKGNLYKKHKAYLESKGYNVMKLDFLHPEESIKYNMFNKTIVPNNKAKADANIKRLAKTIIESEHAGYRNIDPFWDEAAIILITAIIAYLRDYCILSSRKFSMVTDLVNSLIINENTPDNKSPLDIMFDEIEIKDPESFAVKQYKSFRVAAARTLKSILICANAVLCKYADKQIDMIMEQDELDIRAIGKKKTALFICASDTDRTYDGLVNVVFTQIMNGLVEYADICKENRLPIPVRFIMDDFATNVCITDFPRMISSIRSRGISTMIMLQAESQLENYYGYDARTILGSCDTYVYMGGGDIETAKRVSERANVTMHKILDMPVGYEWIFRRGEKPVYTKRLDIDTFKEYYIENINVNRDDFEER